MRLLLPTILALVSFTACTPSTASSGPCSKLCDELVDACDYAAYPTTTSCLEGCAYNEERGGDVEAQLSCVQEAECDTFAIVECENEHGGDDE